MFTDNQAMSTFCVHSNYWLFMYYYKTVVEYIRQEWHIIYDEKGMQ